MANHGRELVASAIALLTEAGQALESGSSIVRYPAQIAALQAEILAVQAAGRRKGTAIIYTAATFCIIFAVSAVASLSFVTKLRSRELRASILSPSPLLCGGLQADRSDSSRRI